MSRTLRRGWSHLTRTWGEGRHRPDWSYGNPNCCGGKVKTMERRRQRARLAEDLRRNPETTPTRPTKDD